MDRLLATLIVAIIILCPTAAAARPLYGSFSLSLDAQALSYDEVPALMGVGTMWGRVGYEFEGQWGVYGIYGMGLGVNIMTFHDFLEFLSDLRFTGGVGAHWRHGRFTMGLEVDGLLSFPAGSVMLSTEVRLLPKVGLLVLEALPVSYAIAFPVTAEFSADGFALSLGVAVSMEVGNDLG